jgi:hypothetical protein
VLIAFLPVFALPWILSCLPSLFRCAKSLREKINKMPKECLKWQN